MGWHEPHGAHVCAGQETACNLPAAASAASVVVAEPGCAGCQALSLRGAGWVHICVQGPHAQG